MRFNAVGGGSRALLGLCSVLVLRRCFVFSGEDPTVLLLLLLLLLLLVSVIDVDGRRVARVFSEATQTRCEESCAEIAESCEDEERVSGRTDLHLLDFNEDTLHFLRCLAVF